MLFGLQIVLDGLISAQNATQPEISSLLLSAASQTTISYTYDSLYRLTDALYSNGFEFHYTYDPVGNRLTQTTCVPNVPCGTTTYSYDDANRLITVDGVAYTWDNAGNLLNDGTSTYSYDSQNRLKTLTQAGHTYAFTYNGQGDRLTQSVDGVTTRYTLDLEAGLTQVLSDGSYAYLYGLDRIAQVSSGETDYFLGDALGSVRQLVDASGAVKLAKNYEPYGSVTGSAGNARSVFAFTGEMYDAQTGLVFLRARYLSATQGRFLNADPSHQEQNLFSYAQSDPVNRGDPSGLITEGEAPEADAIVNELLKVYGVRIVTDWGIIKGGWALTDEYGSTGGCARLGWDEGKWHKLDELKWVKSGVIRLTAGGSGLGGLGKIRSAVKGELTIVRRDDIGTSAPPYGLSLPAGGDVILGDDRAGDEVGVISTVVHEFAHVWDFRTGASLSMGLMKKLGTWICEPNLQAPPGEREHCYWDPYAQHVYPVTNSLVYNDPERPPATILQCSQNADHPTPNCWSYASTYGGTPLLEGPGWEDWAVSLESVVYPDWLQRQG